MRLAVAGKGGAGKTTVSATLARLAARTGTRVVAIDADANPNLATALGLPAATSPPTVPSSLVSRRLDDGGLTVPVDQMLADYAAPGPDGIRLIAMGAPAHADEGCLCAAHAVVRAVLHDLAGAGHTVIVDMEASPEHFSRGTVGSTDGVLLIAEPYYRSLETVRRMAALVAELPVPMTAVLANKVRSDADVDAIAEFCDRHRLALAGALPWSDGIGVADRARIAAADCPAAEQFVAAVAELAAQWGVGGADSSLRGSAPDSP